MFIARLTVVQSEAAHPEPGERVSIDILARVDDDPCAG
jgi:hypothetical protein